MFGGEMALHINLKIPTVTFRGGNIQVWGCISAHSTDRIQMIKRTMNGAMYWEIHEKNLFPSTRMMRMGPRWSYQQDNNPNHIVKRTLNWFHGKKITV